MLGRKVSIGLLVAILGVAAIPAASYSTTATETKETGANAGSLAKALSLDPPWGWLFGGD